MDYEKAAKEIQAQLQPYFNEAHAALKRGDDKPANIYLCAMLSCVAALIVVAQDKDKRADALDAAIDRRWKDTIHRQERTTHFAHHPGDHSDNRKCAWPGVSRHNSPMSGASQDATDDNARAFDFISWRNRSLTPRGGS